MSNEKKTPEAVKALKTTLPQLEELLNAGVHFGHKTHGWNPKMKPYIYGNRGGVHIIDLIKTMKSLKKALLALEGAVERGSVLIVGTKGQAASVVENMAVENGAFYVNKRWPGGLFTNFSAIKKSVDKLISMEETLAAGAQGMVKKEQLMMQRDVDRLNKLYSGIKFMDKLPEMLIVIDSKLEKNAMREAKLLNIPIIAMMDTNCNPDLATYPVPANDDSIKSISLFVDLFGKAMSKGKKSDSVRALRNSAEAKINVLKKTFADETAREEAVAEQERERMKMLRGGSEDKGTVRIVKKQEPKIIKKVESKEVKEKPVKKVEKVVTKTVEDLGLGARAEKAIKEAKLSYVKLQKMNKEELIAVKGIGEKAADDILKAVK